MYNKEYKVKKSIKLKKSLVNNEDHKVWSKISKFLLIFVG